MLFIDVFEVELTANILLVTPVSVSLSVLL